MTILSVAHGVTPEASAKAATVKAPAWATEREVTVFQPGRDLEIAVTDMRCVTDVPGLRVSLEDYVYFADLDSPPTYQSPARVTVDYLRYDSLNSSEREQFDIKLTDLPLLVEALNRALAIATEPISTEVGR